MLLLDHKALEFLLEEAAGVKVYSSGLFSYLVETVHDPYCWFFYQTYLNSQIVLLFSSAISCANPLKLQAASKKPFI